MSFLRYTDKLQIEFGDTQNGKVGNPNYINPRLVWNELEEITTTDDFTHPVDGLVYGSWWRDDGDVTLTNGEREKRLICRKGKASFTVTGKTIIVRAFINPAYGIATVRIDGVVPSTISNVVDAKDTFSLDSDSGDYGTLANVAVNIVLADNLTDTEHTVDLYMNNAETGVGGYVPLIGFYEASTTLSRNIENWIIPWDGTQEQNKNSITISNASSKEMKNIEITFPTEFKTFATGEVIPTLTIASLDPTDTNTTNYQVSFPDTEPLGTESLSVTIKGEYSESSGSIEYPVTVDSHNTGLITFDASWNLDTSGGENRAFTTTRNHKATLTIIGDSITVRVQKDYGWGKLQVKSDTVQVALINCHDSVGGGFYVDVTTTGLGAGTHAIELINYTASKPAPFASVTYIDNYTEVTETLSVNTVLKNIPPYSPTDFEYVGGVFSVTNPVPGAKDLTIPRKNDALYQVVFERRVPTFCVYYGLGKEEIIEKFDIVILDLYAATKQLVSRLQAKGIRVLIYVSMGEETGVLSDPYDPSSTVVPLTGDGTGPGGYASYYNKGGNEFGEVSECQNDRQKLESVQACSQSRAEYAPAPGNPCRCSKSCWNDSRTGYSDFIAGGACAEGYTSANNWSRTASAACSNSSCPDYNPVNSSCPLYSQTTDSYGQDFSILTTNYPDENGIWKSFYVNPLESDWITRLNNYYFPAVFSAHTTYTEEVVTVTIKTYDAVTYPCFSIAHAPIDPDETIVVKEPSSGYIYSEGIEYSFDRKLGSFRMTPLGTSPVLSEGSTLKVTYTNVGLEADGVFMDTVDTVDVYPSTAYKNAFISMINDLKSTYPTKLFCSNRGFTILDDIIASCEYVMFESFLTDYDFESETYSIITDPDSIAFNNGIITQLQTLRASNTFDVLGLNYCPNGNSGNTLRDYIYHETRKNGFLCWTSTILLDDPEVFRVIETNYTDVLDIFKTNNWGGFYVESIS